MHEDLEPTEPLLHELLPLLDVVVQLAHMLLARQRRDYQPRTEQSQLLVELLELAETFFHRSFSCASLVGCQDVELLL